MPKRIRVFFDTTLLPEFACESQKDCENFFKLDSNVKSAQIAWNDAGCAGYGFFIVESEANVYGGIPVTDVYVFD